jgi:hypothetical protein
MLVAQVHVAVAVKVHVAVVVAVKVRPLRRVVELAAVN